jgi:hypothetical protein
VQAERRPFRPEIDAWEGAAIGPDYPTTSRGSSFIAGPTASIRFGLGAWTTQAALEMLARVLGLRDLGRMR